MVDKVTTDNVEVMTWDEFQKEIEMLSLEIRAGMIKAPFLKCNTIYGIPRGGLVVAVVLSHLLDFPLVTNPEHIGQKTLVVDDISDTGKTLSQFRTNVTATLHIVKDTTYVPNFFRKERLAEWVKYPWEMRSVTE